VIARIVLYMSRPSRDVSIEYESVVSFLQMSIPIRMRNAGYIDFDRT